MKRKDSCEFQPSSLMAVGELLNFDACKLQLKLILRVTPCDVNYIMFLSQSLFCFLFVLTFLFL